MDTLVLENRIEKVRDTLRRQKLDALMVAVGENRYYLSGYTGEDSQFDESAGVLFISADHLILATDSRFDQQAKDEALLYEIVCYKKGLKEELPLILKKMGHPVKMGFETVRLTYKIYEELAKSIQTEGMNTQLIPTEDVVETLRVIKSEVEIEATAKALALAENAFYDLAPTLAPGMTESQAAWALEQKIRTAGAQGLSFPSIVASGPNAALPHAIVGQRVFKENETILFDFGARLNHYCSDISRTLYWGNPDDRFLKVFDTVKNAQAKAIAAIKAGASSKAVDQVARQYIEDMGFKDRFGHGLGHGTGLAIHEAPRLSPLRDTTLKEGMIVTVEPGIYIPGWGGVRLENQVVVRKDGAQVLNQSDPAIYRIS